MWEKKAEEGNRQQNLLERAERGRRI